jgi:hypothetical protein
MRRRAAPTAKKTVATDTITISTGDSLPIVLGRLLTFCGLAILLLELLILLHRSVRDTRTDLRARASAARRAP